MKGSLLQEDKIQSFIARQLKVSEGVRFQEAKTKRISSKSSLGLPLSVTEGLSSSQDQAEQEVPSGTGMHLMSKDASFSSSKTWIPLKLLRNTQSVLPYLAHKAFLQIKVKIIQSRFSDSSGTQKESNSGKMAGNP